MNSVVSGNEDQLDICKYVIEKCFDALWTHECNNDLYEAVMTNNKLPLLYKINMNAKVAIKTGQGIKKGQTLKTLSCRGLYGDHHHAQVQWINYLKERIKTKHFNTRGKW